MDSPLADHARRFRANTLAAVAIWILEVEVGTIDSVDTGGASGDSHLVTGIVPQVAGVRIKIIASQRGIDALRRTVVDMAEDDGFQPRTGAGDLLYVEHSLHFFYQDFEADAP